MGRAIGLQRFTSLWSFSFLLATVITKKKKTPHHWLHRAACLGSVSKVTICSVLHHAFKAGVPTVVLVGRKSMVWEMSGDFSKILCPIMARQESHRFWEGFGWNRNHTRMLHCVKLRRQRIGELAPNRWSICLRSMRLWLCSPEPIQDQNRNVTPKVGVRYVLFGAHWPASLGYWDSFQPMRELVSK